MVRIKDFMEKQEIIVYHGSRGGLEGDIAPVSRQYKTVCKGKEDGTHRLTEQVAEKQCKSAKGAWPMTGIEHDICDTQGRIYEYASTFGYDMEVFSKAYLCSDFCHRAMDAPYSRFQLHTEEECWDFIYPEIENI